MIIKNGIAYSNSL